MESGERQIRNHYLKIKWDDHVHFKRTDFNSIKVEVHDFTANRSAEVLILLLTMLILLKIK